MPEALKILFSPPMNIRTHIQALLICTMPLSAQGQSIVDSRASLPRAVQLHGDEGRETVRPDESKRISPNEAPASRVQPQRIVNRIAATVNGRPITANEVSVRLMPIGAQLAAQYPKQGPEFYKQLALAKKNIIEDLVERELLRNEFEGMGGVIAAPWLGLPSLHTPVFSANAMLLIVPVVIILVAENLGHIKAVTAMTGKNLDQYMGRAFIGDGIATMVSGAGGGTGVTTYAENIGVMAATRIYSTAVFLVAALLALLLGFSPKFGALIQAIPLPVMGGVSIVVFGLIAVAGARIWVDNRVNFSDTKNLVVAAITLILGTGEFTLKFGDFALGGIGTATFGAIILHWLLSRGRTA